ncbi:translocation/assembly module TamB domain-containing protein [Pontixanthobacter sp.]|uniref:translocation/assembly module TamB domain-containing protein n=1 Tax=Pontixanthobacter sp. TaxID=2792078 RepID=UPI003C7B6253
MRQSEQTEPDQQSGQIAQKAGISRWLWRGILALVGVLVLGFALINSPIGKRFIADQIAAAAPASGLRLEIGRIDGDVFGDAVLYDVAVLDPKGEFLTIPEITLSWRPLKWLTSGLHVETLIMRRGALARLPELLPGDPDAPLLPDFDVYVGQFAVQDWTLAAGVAGEAALLANFEAAADIRTGRVMLKAGGKLGDRDRLLALIDAQPGDDQFDIRLDYNAPAGGAIASMLDAPEGYSAKIAGEGTWTEWDGAAVIRRSDARLAAFTLTNRAGQYRVLGQAQPGDLLTGLPANTAGKTVSVAAAGTLLDSTAAGQIDFVGRAFQARIAGTADLANNAVDDLKITAALRDPQLFGEALVLNDTALEAAVDGGFRDLSVDYRLSVGTARSGRTTLSGLVQQATATYDGSRWTVPLNVSVARIITDNALIDPQLVGGTIGGVLTYAGDTLFSDDLALTFPSANARLALRGNSAAGSYILAGPVAANGLPIDGIGAVNGSADIDLRIGRDDAWTLAADVDARVPRVTNKTIVTLAGPSLRLDGGVSMGSAAPLDLRRVRLASDKLSLSLNGTVRPGTTSVAGSGSQVDYGDFTIEAALNDTGPTAVLVFASPLPAAGLRDVRVAIAPTDNGLAIDATGESLLGGFDGSLRLLAAADGPAQIAIDRLNVWNTAVTGNIALGEGGADGRLMLSGGGLDGRIGLAAREGGQAFAAQVTADNARFGGDTTISITRANLESRGYLKDGTSTVEGNFRGQGLTYGGLFLGRIAGQAEIDNGRGNVTASVAGRRGNRFNLQLNANFVPRQIAIAAQGDFAGKAIRMPRRAVLDQQDGGGWTLAKTQISYGSGAMLASGAFGGDTLRGTLKLDTMPLSLVDLALADIGLGGTVSGLISFEHTGRSAPTGTARVLVDDLTRSGLVLTSKPIDLALVTNLSANSLEARTIIREDGKQRGRLQARINNMPLAGGLGQRLEGGDLFAQFRFDGPAASVWRLSGVEGFDLTGPLEAAANVTGTLTDPVVRGSVSSDNLRLQSSLSGTDVEDLSVRGTFSGSQLKLRRFAGTTSNGGTVTGSGMIGFLDLATRAPQIDLRISAKNANLLKAAGLNAVVTGPLRIVSSGLGGTIAGRLQVDRAGWNLGTATSADRLPQIRTQEINRPADIAPANAVTRPWRYLIDASAARRIDVDGLGLESEWSADIRLRGTTADPRIGGQARVVRGYYSFAGTRFELTRGQIEFDQEQPIDPRLDIRAETETNTVEVIVSVQGNALQPEITFTSDPLLPEEEILSQLLFGGSITELAATDALQLGAALASLRGGGGGLDPINQLRNAIGLDRLRIVSADAALGRQTGVALGKNIGRKFYVEIITDGRGYSATEAEFRVTSWLSLLGSVSTIGRESVVAEVSRDY